MADQYIKLTAFSADRRRNVTVSGGKTPGRGRSDARHRRFRPRVVFPGRIERRPRRPERVADLLNAETGFFPFEPVGADVSETVMINRAHVVSVRLLERNREPQLDPGYLVATERRVAMLLSTGARIIGAVRVYRPQGRDRLSDYARSSDAFRYVENRDGTFVVNSAHIVELRESLS